MFVFINTPDESSKLPIRFHCPACGERDVDGMAWTERDELGERLYWVSGSCCERQLYSRLKPKTLIDLDTDTIEAQGVIFDRISPVKFVLLIGAFLFCIVPLFGPVFLVLAWLPSGSSRLWFRIACRVCLFLQILAMNLFVIALLGERK